MLATDSSVCTACDWELPTDEFGDPLPCDYCAEDAAPAIVNVPAPVSVAPIVPVVAPVVAPAVDHERIARLLVDLLELDYPTTADESMALVLRLSGTVPAVVAPVTDEIPF